MLFNSINFAIFLPIVFMFYWFVVDKSLKSQNLLLLISSYFFYACWDWRFLFLLIFSTLLDYFTGIKINESSNKNIKKFWFWTSVVINLGFLGVFKYYNFFLESFAVAISKLGLYVNPWTLNVILPVGISFYTFHGLSYVIDIYNEKIKPDKNVVTYSLFVSFFPLLVAGPIERATHLLPQIQKKRFFNYENAVVGLKQILWGLFKKMVIADNCAELANTIFNNFSDYSGSTLVLGAVFFAFQIYGDFSGYSDIAIGTAKLFGIDLLRNFAFPYFSRSIPEFWRRWHMSLSNWFRDYLYIPLGGSNGGFLFKIRNVFIVFLISGFWHGANWTFIVWGFLNALYMLPSLIFKSNRKSLDIVAQGKYFPSFKEFISMGLTFSLIVFAWIFFRSVSLEQALGFISRIFSASLLTMPDFPGKRKALTTILILVGFIIVEWIGREHQFAIEMIGYKYKRRLRWVLYGTIIFLIGMLMHTSESPFIYFQF